MIERHIIPQAHFNLTQFRALCITGPRQSGKTTLSKQLFTNKPYVNFENPSVQFQAELDLANFLKQYQQGAIFDEVQRVPILFRYLQEMLDTNTARGQFILTGSNNFLLQEQVSQSLAGRAGYLSLLPLSYAELKDAAMANDDFLSLILKGGYPEIWKENLSPEIWLKSYLATYVQQDVRLIRNITNLSLFVRFIQLCANSAGQILNRDNFAKLLGIDSKTVLAWLGLLESSYIIYLLQPWHNNLNKRLIRSPKLYFYDTGLLCSLLGIKTTAQLNKHTHYGALFENWVLTEIRKNNYNKGQTNGMYYFRDNTGNEIDLILERDGEPIAIEVKASSKVESPMLRGLQFWQKYRPNNQSLLIYAGLSNDEINELMHVVPWKDLAII
ncbi:MAG: ATP-binding protein [Chitinophagaceae bacterium]